MFGGPKPEPRRPSIWPTVMRDAFERSGLLSPRQRRSRVGLDKRWGWEVIRGGKISKA